MRISLDYEDFKCLVRGGILKVSKDDSIVLVKLQDIGFDKMDDAIFSADKGIDIGKGRTKEI